MKARASGSLLAGVVGAALAPLFVAADATACGCFAPPVPQPDVQGNFAVNQRAEQIIFEVEPGFVSAHVRILYEGDPEQFAWLLPMPSVPDIELSETDLFAYVDQQTAPNVRFQSANLCPAQNYVCRTHPPCPVYGTPTPAGSAAPGSPVNYAAAGPDQSLVDPGSMMATAPPVTVLASAQVGAYDTITFAAEEADLAIQWLNDNGFIVNETMSPYMQPYLDSGLVFVASKLIPGSDLDEIRPLKLRYEAAVPSIPLRLTAIAAEPHMTVTAFIYANDAFDPVIAPLIELPQEELSSATGRNNYPMVLARSVDEMGGFAFVREYVGPGPSFLDSTGCCTTGGGARQELPPLASDAGPAGDAGAADAGASDAGNPPLPMTPAEPELSDVCGVGGDGQCQCPGAAFDAVDCGEGLVAGITKANELAAQYPTLTRLTTRISPEEMVEDPRFEPAQTPVAATRLTLLGTTNVLTGCEGQVEDGTRYAEILEDQDCTSMYCDWGECAITEYGAGCRCDAGFVARMFTDTDGQPSFTCVPETPPVDFAAGGLDLPSACDGARFDAGECVDLGGFAALRCAADEAAVFARPIIGQPTLTCSAVTRETSSQGATNYSRALLDLDVCAPPPPMCASNGWLEELDVQNPGKDCGEGPDPSWLVPPPPPVCPPPPAPGTAASATPVATPVIQPQPVITDTRAPRPELGDASGGDGATTTAAEDETTASLPNASSGDDGCSLHASSSRGGFPWSTVAFLGALGVLVRRRRRSP